MCHLFIQASGSNQIDYLFYGENRVAVPRTIRTKKRVKCLAAGQRFLEIGQSRQANFEVDIC